MSSTPYTFFSSDHEVVIRQLGRDRLLAALRQMLLIRHFEVRAESAYQQGLIGGFFHAYIGQEAIQTAAVAAIGKENWWTTTYRCHALALLLGVTPEEAMAEFYGRATGNAKGRGGSMHLFSDRLLGGHGIVGGQIPVGTGAAFTAKYQESGEVSVCFLGDGAVAQGSFHESLNLASLWSLPCIYVIENNIWGMGTNVDRAICVKPIAEKKAPSFGMEGYTFDGMDFFNCYAGFAHVYEKMKRDSRPVLIEVVTERFRGHSISDPAFYRSKDELKECLKRDPITLFTKRLIEAKFLTEAEYEAMDQEEKEKVLLAMKYADESPWPDPITLEEDVFAP